MAKATARQIYTSAHGKIPKGYVLVFLDGDKCNWFISNLKAMPRSEAMKRKVKKTTAKVEEPVKAEDAKQLHIPLEREKPALIQTEPAKKLQRRGEPVFTQKSMVRVKPAPVKLPWYKRLKNYISDNYY